MNLEKLNPMGQEAVSVDFKKLQRLLEELKTRELPEDVVVSLNNKVQKLNSFSGTVKQQKIEIAKMKLEIFTLLERKLNLVPKRHYLNLWMLLGMTCFGLPLGTVLSTAMDNYGLIGTGLPIGMFIGMAVGTSMDKKAKQEGRQLGV